MGLRGAFPAVLLLVASGAVAQERTEFAVNFDDRSNDRSNDRSDDHSDDRPDAPARMRAAMARNAPPPGVVCAALDDIGRANLGRMATGLADATPDAKDQRPAMPRLPVTNPCL